MTAVAARPGPATAPPGTGGRRWVVVVADQAVNSLTNVVVVLLVAAAVPLREFGVFAAVTVVVQLVQSVAAAGIGDRLLQAAPEARVGRYRAGARVLDVLAVVGAVVGVVGVVVFDADPWWVGAALAPALARIDLWRVRTIGHAGRPGTALAVDVALGLAQVVGVLVWDRSGTPGGSGGALAVWAAVALATAAVLAARAHRLPGAPARLTEAVSLRYGVEMAAVNGSGQIAQLVVTAQLGFAFSGTLRAAQVPFGFVVVLVLAARAVLIPAMRAADEDRARRLAWIAAGAAVVASAAFTGVTVLAAAVAPLRFLVGGVHLQPAFVVALGCGYAAVAGGMVQTYFLRARHRDREVSVGRVVMLVLLAVGTAVAVVARSSWVFLAALAVAWLGASVVMATIGGQASRSEMPNVAARPTVGQHRKK